MQNTYLGYLPRELQEELARYGVWSIHLARLPPELRKELRKYLLGLHLLDVHEEFKSGMLTGVARLMLITPDNAYIFDANTYYLYRFDITKSPRNFYLFGQPYSLSSTKGKLSVLSSEREEILPEWLVPIVGEQLQRIKSQLPRY